MFWTEEIATRVTGAQIVNDSKTPSGRVHVGALRGVLIHDAIFRTLRDKGIEARYLFGVDDYDPVDEIPKGEDAHFGQYIGRPLCNTPAPHGGEGDMAEYYMREFWQVFEELGVKVERYRMRDIYRAGQFNEPIDKILRHAADVRRVYKQVSGSEQPEHWFPFQVICENCGRIATTEVNAYDGTLVSYRCLTTKVVNTKENLGRGCGHEGKVSPFNGNGKLPWKLEWVAKWVQFPVTIEGAGKDHSTKGGSRDVSEACLQAIYGTPPPLRVPYEFFLVGGAKMSSSKGVGASARDMANLLPPEVLRFLMIRTKPNTTVSFGKRDDKELTAEAAAKKGAIDEETIVKVFNEFDRYQARVTHEKTANADETCIYKLCELTPEGDYFNANFQVVAALVQMPHLDVVEQITKRKGSPLTEVERKHLDQRIASAKLWLENYAGEDDKTRLQETLPARAQELGVVQRAFLQRLAAALPGTKWEDDVLQSKVFEVARLTPIEQPVAFKAIYRVLLDKEAGPKAGNLLAFLEPEFVIARFQELPYERVAFWRESAVTEAELQAWATQNAEKIAGKTWSVEAEGDVAAYEIVYEMKDGKRQLKRLLVQGYDASATVPPGAVA
jgi:lysyl-tRNA synthetase class 1